MKQKSGLIGVVYAAILSAIAGYFFPRNAAVRQQQRSADRIQHSNGLCFCAGRSQSGKEVCL